MHDKQTSLNINSDRGFAVLQLCVKKELMSNSKTANVWQRFELQISVN